MIYCWGNWNCLQAFGGITKNSIKDLVILASVAIKDCQSKYPRVTLIVFISIHAKCNSCLFLIYGRLLIQYETHPLRWSGVLLLWAFFWCVCMCCFLCYCVRVVSSFFRLRYSCHIYGGSNFVRFYLFCGSIYHCSYFSPGYSSGYVDS